MKEYFLIAICIIVVFGVIYMVYPNKTVEANKLEIGSSDYGQMYIDTDTVTTVKKDEQYFLVVNAEEYYTDEKFLEKLQAKENIKDAGKITGATYLYMFTNDGKYYCTPQTYLFDKDEKICVDLGSDLELKAVDSEVLFNIYTKSLDALSQKQQTRNMFKF